MTDDAAPAAAAPCAPPSLALLFGDPDAIRQAIMLNEILQPPGTMGIGRVFGVRSWLIETDKPNT